jgi:hypothetical protein
LDHITWLFSKGSAASCFALAISSRGTALTIAHLEFKNQCRISLFGLRPEEPRSSHQNITYISIVREIRPERQCEISLTPKKYLVCQLSRSKTLKERLRLLGLTLLLLAGSGIRRLPLIRLMRPLTGMLRKKMLAGAPNSG